MQKITRIYVGNYGIDMAWYDGITLDLTEPASGEPTDTIINLENGGGKTTLLSFIFSCFETAQERFLKHIQNKNHRFSQYFAKDGLPGVVLVEWEMPSRVAGGAPYRLVIGQAVAVRSSADREEVDRVFFSFEATSELHFGSVPAPKLSMAPVNTMADFSRWMHEAQKSASDFFYTRTQQDWQRHLRDERLIDVEMLQLQVAFSAQEGGIDAGFLTFHSEPEFVRKFLDLTLDAERAAAVRLAIVNTCDKLRRKPFFQSRLAELETLQASLTHFDSLAQAYRIEADAQRETLQRGGGLILSLEARDREKTQLASTQTQASKAQDALATENGEAEQRHSAEEVVLRALGHSRNVRAAEHRKGQADANHVVANKKLLHLQAAEARGEIMAAQTVKNSLEEQVRQANAELEPWLNTVQQQGAILRRALFDEEQRLREDSKTAGAQEQTAVGAQKELSAELSRLGVTETKCIGERAKLNAAEDAYELAKTQLVNDELLEVNEATPTAIERWRSVSVTKRGDEARCLGEAQTLFAQEQTWRNQAGVDQAEAARLQATIEQRQQFIAEGQAEREALSQLSIMRLAVDAETADPDSVALPTALERLILSSERELSQSDVHLAELNASKASIEETGVAGSSRDVNSVVAWLRQHGVSSARAYNAYISQAVPNAEQARTLVASNPARFLGVCVAKSDLVTAQSLAAPVPQLTSPVMISVATLDPTQAPTDQRVINAADDAAFNLAAATVLLTTLESRLAAENSRRQTFATRVREALAGKQRLAAYQARFGEGALHTAGADVSRFTSEKGAAIERAEAAKAKAVECQNAAVGFQQTASQLGQEARDAERHAQDLQRFVDKHESGHATRLANLEELQVQLTSLVERRAEIQLEAQQHAEAEKDAYRAKLDLDAKAGLLGTERSALKHYDSEFAAAEYLAEHPHELPLLRKLYADAAQTYEAQAKDRIGVLHQQLQYAQTEFTQKTAAFTKNFPGVQGGDMAPYHGANFEVEIPAARGELGQAQMGVQEAGNALAVAHSQLKEFHTAHKPAFAPSAEMDQLTDAELTARVEQVSALKGQATEAARCAQVAATRARELSRQAQAEAKEAASLAKMLRSALTLPDLIVADPVELVGDVGTQANETVAAFNAKASAVQGARGNAYKAFDALKTAANRNELHVVEPEIATQLQRNDFDAACADSQRLLEGILDRIGTTQASLNGMQADFEAGLGELFNLTNSAITLLNSAVNNKKVPEAAPYVGGKALLKMRARFQEISPDVRRQALQLYLDHLIVTNVVPAKGPEMVAEALLRIHGKALGLQMLKMVPDEALQYVPVDKIQNSGGEGVVMAMFLYLLINQLRSETQAKLKKMGGGPLILDNPFAKATTPTLWKAQRLLAQSMDVQLIFATALPDYNTVGEFNRFIRLRKAGKNSKTGRWHLEAADFKLHEPVADLA